MDVRSIPARRVVTVVHAMVARGDCIDGADVLRARSAAEVLGHRVMAPSTLRTFLRGSEFGHVRQLDCFANTLLARAWTLGTGPGAAPLTIDLDSSICEGDGTRRQSAARLATCTPSVTVCCPQPALTPERYSMFGSASARQGQEGVAQRFGHELPGWLRRCGAMGTLTLSADTGLYLHPVKCVCRRSGECSRRGAPMGRAALKCAETPADRMTGEGGPAGMCRATLPDGTVVALVYDPAGGADFRGEFVLSVEDRTVAVAVPVPQSPAPSASNPASDRLSHAETTAFRLEHDVARDLRVEMGLPSGKARAAARRLVWETVLAHPGIVSFSTELPRRAQEEPIR